MNRRHSLGPAGRAALAVAASLVSSGAIGCGGSADASPQRDAARAGPATAAPEAAVVSELAVAESTSIAAPLLLHSQLYVEQDAIVAARATGILDSLAVDLGASVSKGEVLGRVEDEAQRLALARTTVAWENAQRVAWRATELRNVNGITASDAEQAEFQLKLAEVARREAEHALERTRILAPFGGVVSARYARPGRLVAIHDTLLRVSARGPHLARVRVPEAGALALRVGRPVTVVDVAGRRVAGRITRIAPAIDAASATREVIVRVADALPPAAASPMLTGSTVWVELALQSRRVLTVPRSALADGGFVVVAQGGRSMVRAVVTGIAEGERIEIVSGLQVGERVLRHAK